METQSQTINTIIASSTNESANDSTNTAAPTRTTESLTPLTISTQGPPSAWSPHPSPPPSDITVNLTSGTQPCIPNELSQLNPDELLLEEPSESGVSTNTNTDVHEPNTAAITTSIFNSVAQHYNH